jgi:hypothetical protein
LMGLSFTYLFSPFSLPFPHLLFPCAVLFPCVCFFTERGVTVPVVSMLRVCYSDLGFLWFYLIHSLFVQFHSPHTYSLSFYLLAFSLSLGSGCLWRFGHSSSLKRVENNH